MRVTPCSTAPAHQAPTAETRSSRFDRLLHLSRTDLEGEEGKGSGSHSGAARGPRVWRGASATCTPSPRTEAAPTQSSHATLTSGQLSDCAAIRKLGRNVSDLQAGGAGCRRRERQAGRVSWRGGSGCPTAAAPPPARAARSHPRTQRCPMEGRASPRTSCETLRRKMRCRENTRRLGAQVV